MPFGTAFDGEVALFRLWAPLQSQVRLEIDGEAPLAMEPVGDGRFERRLRRPAGTRYRFLLADGATLPDPASRFQPEDVHGFSELIDPAAFAWTDADWSSRPFEEAVLYELHVGTFTREGTFRAAAEKLDHLAALGVTAIELMPIGDFAGPRNWGYDGVLPFAPDSAYGRPEDLKAFVDAAHARGLMVFLDVIYNHFGPEGFRMPLVAPVFTPRHRTPWGDGINYDDEGSRLMRAFAVHNALFWLEEYHLDGLRLDAVHGIVDDSRPHLLDELADRVRAAFPDRHVHLVLENEENEAFRLEREDGRPRRYTAQWNDDVHHVLHCAVTGEDAGYYADYAGDTGMLGRALAEGFVFTGQTMPYRGSPRGEPSGHLPSTAFVSFLQNHDQIGNRAFGDRITSSAPPEAVRAALAVVLLSPQIPMLFMGEEWGSTRPFPFFAGFTGELGDAVREGRRKEFARFPEFQDPARRERIPDPIAEATFLSAKLDWGAIATDGGAARLAWTRRLLAVRHAEIVPRLAGMTGHAGACEVLGTGAVAVRWRMGDGSVLRLVLNLSGGTVDAPPPLPRLLWREGARDGSRLGPWTAEWSAE